MKNLLLFTLFGLSSPIVFVGCGTTQSQNHYTLSGIGLAAKATIDTAAELLAANKITVDQFKVVASAYNQFQVIFRAAVEVSIQDYSKPASSEVISAYSNVVSKLAEVQ